MRRGDAASAGTRVSWRGPAVLALCASTLLAGCAQRSPTFHAWPPAPGALDVSMREYAFDHAGTLRPGRTIVRLRNNGEGVHQLVLMRLPDDLQGTLDDQLRSEVRRPLAITTLLPGVRPRTGTAFAVDLTPGRYGLVCYVEDADGRTHALKGMNSELRVERPPPAGRAGPQGKRNTSASLTARNLASTLEDGRVRP